MSRVALAVCALLVACGSGTGKLGEQPRWRKHQEGGQEMAGSAHLSGPITFAPTSTAAGAYNDPPVEPAPPSAMGEAIIAAIDDAAAGLGVDPPVADGRLFAAAGEIAEVVPEEGVVPYPLVEFALQHHGIVEPSPHLLVIWGPLDDPEAIVDQLRPRIGELLGGTDPKRLGVGSFATGDGGGIVVVAIQATALSTRPIPRALPDGGKFRVEGEVAAGYRSPEVYVTHDDGSVSRARAGQGTSRKFATDVDCDGRRGKQQVEITAIDGSGSSVLANFPVWCNEAAPLEITVRPSDDDLAPVATEAEAEERMLALVNRDRAANNLPPLEWDERAAEVARGHSSEMRDTGNVAHVSPTTGTAADRVKAGGIRSAAVLENIARAYGVSEAEDGLMNSPGHRANLMSTAVTHIGIGITFGDQVAGRREMFVTQVFIRVTPPIDRGEVTERLRASIEDASHVMPDDALDRIAVELADAIAGGEDRKQASARASKQLEKLSRRFAKVGSVVTTVADLDAVDAKTLLGDVVATHMGLGVAQGTHEELGEGAVFIVLLLGVTR